MRFVQNSDIAWRIYDGEAVLVDPQGSVCRVLNETAARIWSICEQPSTVQEIAENMEQEYDVSLDQLNQDIEKIIRELTGKNLLLEEDKPKKGKGS